MKQTWQVERISDSCCDIKNDLNLDVKLFANKDVSIQNDAFEELFEFLDVERAVRDIKESERKNEITFFGDSDIKEPTFFGDMRDSGYILSLSQMHKRADKTTGTFQELELIATCEIGCMAYELDLKIPALPGYGGRDE